MITASPITRQTVGRTFIGAITLLGFVALVQLGTVVRAFIIRSDKTAAFEPSTSPAAPSATPLSKPDSEETNFTANPINNENATAPVASTSETTPPKPTPLQNRPTAPVAPEQSARFKETLAQGKQLRERGDMSTALTRFREAAAMDSRSPEAIYEMALTYEKMQLADRASEQWRRIYDMGDSAGPFFTAAEAKLNQVKEAAMRQAISDIPQNAEEEFPAGKVLTLGKISVEEKENRTLAKDMILRIPIKSRPRENVDVAELTIQVLFYDIVDNQNLVQTSANVSSRFTTAPADWAEGASETLEVEYQLPLTDGRSSRRENRKYFGYLIRIYYKGELQASGGEPEKLVQQFPPENKLESPKN